ncbi:MAG: nucleotidyltransferase domain-containing protein [Chloroflexota bacterium]|nr:nucleotidyltransferase domain-containing protein [Chloroflexota bacterium]MDQ5864692.1 nucleotidyltransferase domain-containing protein [Chloroflexota bacterium]
MTYLELADGMIDLWRNEAYTLRSLVYQSGDSEMAEIIQEASAGEWAQITQQVVSQIVAGFHPKTVILFGSYAYGAPNSDSDLDLLVVMEDVDNPLRMAAKIAAEIDHPVPLDIVVFDANVLMEAVARQAVFATEITSRGKVLYEA